MKLIRDYEVESREQMSRMLIDLVRWGFSMPKVAEVIGAENPEQYSKTLLQMKNKKNVGIYCGVFNAVRSLHEQVEKIHRR